MNKNLKLINKYITEKRGKDPTGRPLWRLVWSDDQVEKRYGFFRDFFMRVILREVTETRETKKYPWVQERWILEKLVFAPQKELPESNNGHYELVWVLMGNDGQYLPLPTARILDYFFWCVDNPQKRTKGDYEETERVFWENETEVMENYLNEGTGVSGKETGETVAGFYSKTYEVN